MIETIRPECADRSSTSIRSIPSCHPSRQVWLQPRCSWSCYSHSLQFWTGQYGSYLKFSGNNPPELRVIVIIQVYSWKNVSTYSAQFSVMMLTDGDYPVPVFKTEPELKDRLVKCKLIYHYDLINRIYQQVSPSSQSAGSVVSNFAQLWWSYSLIRISLSSTITNRLTIIISDSKPIPLWYRSTSHHSGHHNLNLIITRIFSTSWQSGLLKCSS